MVRKTRPRTLRCPETLLVALVAVGLSWCPSLSAETDQPERDAPHDPSPVVSPVWVVMQFVPSPGVALGKTGVHGTMSWQSTPLSYSFGTDPRLNRFRFFVVEPLYRHSGSVELFFDPAYVGRAGTALDRFGFRGGARATLPLVARGDYLSFSAGAGVHVFRNAVGPSFEAGMTILFGGLGLFVKVAPWFDDDYLEMTFRLRWF